MKGPLIKTIFLDHLDEIVFERGGDIRSFVDMAGLPLSVIAEKSDLVPFSFHSRLLDLTAERIQVPELGLMLASRQSVEYLGPIHALVSKESTLRQALQVFCSHLALQVQAVDTRVEEHEHFASFVLSNKIPDIQQSTRYQDHAVALAFNLLKWLCPEHWNPRAIFFPRRAPKDLDAYVKFFNAPLCFEADSLRISFDQKLLDQPIDTSAHKVSDRLRHALSEKRELDVSDQVKFLIQSLITSSHCDTNEIASILGYTRRTLQRRLEEEGTSYQMLLDGTRANLAKTYLQNNHYRIGDIATMLGFSNQACFTRSFERWFSMTPSAWRRCTLGNAKANKLLSQQCRTGNLPPLCQSLIEHSTLPNYVRSLFGDHNGRSVGIATD